MATLAYPTLKLSAPSKQLFRLVANTQSFASPLNGSVQTVELPGARWAGQIFYETLEDPDIRLLESFLDQLRGRAGRFNMLNFARLSPSGVGTGSPVVSASGQTGVTLATSGWTISQTGIMKAGDLFVVNTELKRIVTTVNSSGTGTATLTFEPPLRASPPLSAVITVNSPTVKCMLSDDNQNQIEMYGPNLGSLTMNFVEAFT